METDWLYTASFGRGQRLLTGNVLESSEDPFTEMITHSSWYD